MFESPSMQDSWLDCEEGGHSAYYRGAYDQELKPDTQQR